MRNTCGIEVAAKGSGRKDHCQEAEGIDTSCTAARGKKTMRDAHQDGEGAQKPRNVLPENKREKKRGQYLKFTQQWHRFLNQELT